MHVSAPAGGSTRRCTTRSSRLVTTATFDEVASDGPASLSGGSLRWPRRRARFDDRGRAGIPARPRRHREGVHRRSGMLAVGRCRPVHRQRGWRPRDSRPTRAGRLARCRRGARRASDARAPKRRARDVRPRPSTVAAGRRRAPPSHRPRDRVALSNGAPPRDGVCTTAPQMPKWLQRRSCSRVNSAARIEADALRIPAVLITNDGRVVLVGGLA